MEVDELPQFDPNVDYNEILPIHQKRTIAFLNHFLTNTAAFLNNFSESCEGRLAEFEYKLQKVEASLLILEAQLSSIPDDSPVEQIPLESKEELRASNETVEVLIDLPEVKVVEEEREVKGTVASKDPRFSRFFKMVQFGVPPPAVKQKMEAEGLDSSILDAPNSIIPGYAPQASINNNDGNTTDSSSS